MADGRARVGCSGWEYAHWRGDFYPPALRRPAWFEHYARTFDTVEINNTFYRLPEETTFEAWSARAPRGFVYAVKASRYLTHMKKVKDPEEPDGSSTLAAWTISCKSCLAAFDTSSSFANPGGIRRRS